MVCSICNLCFKVGYTSHSCLYKVKCFLQGLARIRTRFSHGNVVESRHNCSYCVLTTETDVSLDISLKFSPSHLSDGEYLAIILYAPVVVI